MDASPYSDLQDKEQRTRAAQDRKSANAEEVDEGQDEDAEDKSTITRRKRKRWATHKFVVTKHQNPL